MNGDIILFAICSVHSNAQFLYSKLELCYNLTSSRNVRIARKVKQLRMQSETRFGQHVERNSLCDDLLVRW